MVWAPRCAGGWWMIEYDIILGGDPNTSELPTTVVGVAVGALLLVALAVAVFLLLRRKKSSSDSAGQNQDTDHQEVWTPSPPHKRAPETTEDSTYDEMYTEVKDTKAKAPKKEEEEGTYTTEYPDSEYLEV